MLLAMARDVRVMLIKLADRLHNMRTLDAVEPEKRRRIARETLEIYAPIAHRLGLNNLFRELEELSFEHLHPLRYRVLQKAVLAARGNRREVLGKILLAVRKALQETKLRAEVYGREKTLYGIYRKMLEKNLSFSEVLDIYGFRVVVENRDECYIAMGALHALYKPVPGKFKDYIAIPKVNGYQSLHTTLIGPYGTPVEFQIRTREMHHVAESGVAAALALQGRRFRPFGAAVTHPPVAAVAAGDPAPHRRLERVPRAHQGRSVPRQGLCVHAEGQDRLAAARRDAGRLRLRHSYRRGQPMRRRAHQRRN